MWGVVLNCVTGFVGLSRTGGLLTDKFVYVHARVRLACGCVMFVAVKSAGHLAEC